MTHKIIVTSTDVGPRTETAYVRDSFLILAPGPITFVAWLIREPLEGGVTEQVVRNGTGALHIDPCRVDGKRWPTNLLLIHSTRCVFQGWKRVPGHKGYPNGPGGKSMQYTSDKRGKDVRPQAWAGYADASGFEKTPLWECVSECPVHSLDEMSGERPSTLAGRGSEGPTANPSKARPAAFFGLWVGGLSNVYGDTGGASRFFMQFASLREVLQWLHTLTKDAPSSTLSE
jgi:hypothetical protein